MVNCESQPIKKTNAMRTASLALAVLLAPVARADGASHDQKLVCFEYSSFRMDFGETITGHGASAEAGGIEITGPSGVYEIGESEIFRRDQKGEQVYEGNGALVLRMAGDHVVYMAYGRAFEPTDIPLVMLNGPALTGDGRDEAIYSRIAISDPSQLNCDETDSYSWEKILGGK